MEIENTEFANKLIIQLLECGDSEIFYGFIFSSNSGDIFYIPSNKVSTKNCVYEFFLIIQSHAGAKTKENTRPLNNL